MEKIKPWAAAMAIAVCYGIAGTMDYEDAVAMEDYRAAIAAQTTHSK